jgi:hypothetical protein
VDAPFIWGVAGMNVAVLCAFTAIVASGARGVLPDVRAYVMGSYPFNRLGQARIERAAGA